MNGDNSIPDVNWQASGFNMCDATFCLSNPVTKQIISGSGNIYTLYNLPLDVSRSLGYNQCTVIKLDWMGLLRCEALGYFNAQSDNLRQDCDKYGMYRPKSVTVKIIPKFPRPPSKYGTFVSDGGTIVTSSTKDGEYTQHAGVSTVSGAWTGGSAVASGGGFEGDAVEIYGFKKVVNSTPVLHSGYDDDALNLYGYIVPQSGDGDNTSSTTSRNLENAVWSSYFAGIGRVPAAEFWSNFRRLGFARSYISHSRPTKFKYKFDKGILRYGTVYLGPTSQTYTEGGSTQYLPDNKSYLTNPSIFYYCGRTNPNADIPFINVHSCVKPGWISADWQSVVFPRTNNNLLPNPLDPGRHPVDLLYHERCPVDCCSVIIPGINVENFMNQFNLQFTYSCVYTNKIFDYE